MKLNMQVNNPYWWFWPLTLAFMIAAVAGWNLAYIVVMVLSLVQVVLFWARERSPWAFTSQERIVYFALTLFGLWPAVRLYIYILLILGTIMVTFFGRCSISMLLKGMPWNRGRAPQLY
jgi:hypothetical protein